MRCTGHVVCVDLTVPFYIHRILCLHQTLLLFHLYCTKTKMNPSPFRQMGIHPQVTCHKADNKTRKNSYLVDLKLNVWKRVNSKSILISTELKLVLKRFFGSVISPPKKPLRSCINPRLIKGRLRYAILKIHLFPIILLLLFQKSLLVILNS